MYTFNEKIWTGLKINIYRLYFVGFSNSISLKMSFFFVENNVGNWKKLEIRKSSTLKKLPLLLKMTFETIELCTIKTIKLKNLNQVNVINSKKKVEVSRNLKVLLKWGKKQIFP